LNGAGAAASPVPCADSSIAIAAFGRWHEHHRQAVEAVAREPRLVAHAGVEAYSVLTRLPDPFRADPRLTIEYLAKNFPAPRLTLDEESQAKAPEVMQAAGVTGGAVYDGLVALTADRAGATLLSLDRRAARTYDRLAVDYELLL
jgi:predicted nucleic acid-binding protein